jgi:hypothetical protein
LPKNGALTDDEQETALAKVVELAQERAKILYLHGVRDSALTELSNAFDQGFIAAIEFCASDEFQFGATRKSEHEHM